MKALIFGITGQLGSYLAETLLEKGYDVYGCVRRTSSGVPWRLASILGKVQLLAADVTDYVSVYDVILKTRPAEIYICSGFSNSHLSWSHPEVCLAVNGLGVLRILEAIRLFVPKSRVFHASSAEIFSIYASSPQTVSAPTEPCSAYGVSKLYAHHMVKLFRESYGIYAVNGVLFSVESPRKSEEFITRRITRGIGRIKAGVNQRIEVGNLELKRDFVHARDCALAAWLMLQQKTPKDYLIGSGRGYSYKDFVEQAFKYAEMTWTDHVVVSDKLFTYVEHPNLVADANEITGELGWLPAYDFDKIVQEMVEVDIQTALLESQNKNL